MYVVVKGMQERTEEGERATVTRPPHRGVRRAEAESDVSHFWKVLQRTWRAVHGHASGNLEKGRKSSTINLHLIAFACAALRVPRKTR